MQAAIHVYVAKGYAAANLSDIADQAGLAHGLVYYYFKNKRQLFRELYEYMRDQSLQYTAAYFEQDAPVLEQFKNYAVLVCERAIKDPKTQRFYMRISLDLHHLYEPGELSPFDWMKCFIKPMAQAIDKGIKNIIDSRSVIICQQFARKFGLMPHPSKYGRLSAT
ncbi:TetR/AcrR family transcriptional regulator [Paenibacillus sp. SN-8-1]|uniref:TetR/AcrR family transcriptional regulator n=1 Tax=Paenibacillus sp. SN-8-1 TaxID=3435409 RepID=UPI003D9A79CE